MADVIPINPFCCRMWNGHERLEDQINEATCREEIKSVLNHGQQIPVLGRPLKGDRNHSYELVYGARRLFIARHLNVPLLTQVRELSDREAIIALEIENRQRKDLSPYERGRSYNAWLRSGLFASQDELGRVLNVSASQVSRLIKLTQLPTVLLNAFSAPTEICESWGRDLMRLWEDSEKRSALITIARAIASERRKPAAQGIYQQLMSSALVRRKAVSRTELDDHDEVITDNSGKPLFRIRVHRKDVAFLLPSMDLSGYVFSAIKEQLSTILQRARSQALDLEEQSNGQIKRLKLASRIADADLTQRNQVRTA